MSNFVYFVEQQSLQQDDLDRLGIADMFSSFPAVRQTAGGKPGPGDKAGCAFGPVGKDIGYYPQSQTWIQAQGYWLGWKTDDPPGPADLKREQMAAGQEVELGDGNLWHVPKVRIAHGSSELPMVYKRNPLTGELEARLVSKFHGLYQRVVEIFEDLKNFDWTKLHDLCVDILAVNYRIDVAACYALELMTSTGMVEIFKVASDIEATLKAMESDEEKKSA